MFIHQIRWLRLVGWRSYGILADGNASNYPVRVIKSDDSNLSDVIEVSAGNFISMFLCADGTVWIYGTGYGNKAIQLLNQDGSTVTYRYFRWGKVYPVPSDGTVWAKGGNADGVLGTGESPHSNFRCRG